MPSLRITGIYGDSRGLWSDALSRNALLSEHLFFFNADKEPPCTCDTGVVIATNADETLPDELTGKPTAIIISNTSSSIPDDTHHSHISYFLCPVSLRDICVFLTEQSPASIGNAEGYIFNPNTRELRKGKDVFRLTELERNILAALDVPRSAEELSITLWGRANDHTLHSVRSAASRLRQKCSDIDILKYSNDPDSQKYAFFN